MYRSTGFGSAMLDAEVQDGGIRAVLSNKSTVTLKPGRQDTITWTSSDGSRSSTGPPRDPTCTQGRRCSWCLGDLAEVIGRHELDGPRCEHARAVEHAAFQEHLGEARVVAGRGDGAAPAAVELPRDRGIVQLVLLARVGMRGQRLRHTRALSADTRNIVSVIFSGR
jgi:hypothetical protein